MNPPNLKLCRIVLILSAIALIQIGCKSEANLRTINTNNILDPELVSVKGPKGKLYRAKIERNGDNHWVYWFENSSTISINVEKSHAAGKAVVTKVHTIVIDGVEYVPKLEK